MKVIQSFKTTYKKEPAGVAFCPYRICPLGAHIDHQLGKITGFAINKGIQIAYAPKQNGVIELSSLQFEKRAQWHIKDVAKEKQGDWADYLRGATLALSSRYPLKVGLCGVIEGSLPIGGLSSSAAVTLAFISALCKVNDLSLSPFNMIAVAQEAENKYVGVSCGKLDQSCEVLCQKGHLLYLDTKDDSYTLIPTNPQIKPYKIAILFSGLERNLATSKYNMRIDECKSAAYAIKAFAGMEYGKLKDTFLRDIPYETYVEHKEKLPSVWQKRAKHYFDESIRVEKGIQAWKAGDLEAFGKLIFESGQSSIDNYEAGSIELITLFNILKETEGVYGGRFSGAGFKGCCMALIDPDKENSIIKTVTEKYTTIFSHLKEKFCIYICESGDGVNL